MVPGLKFGPIRQLAFLVEDVERAALDWAATFGAGPFWLLDAKVPDTIYRGDTCTLEMRIALGQLGVHQIELIQPGKAPSVYREYMDGGGVGLHHVCYWHDPSEATRLMAEMGFDAVQSGVIPEVVEFAYLSGPFGPPYIEFVDPRFGSGSSATWYAEIASEHEKWDGREPLRGQTMEAFTSTSDT